MMNLTGGRVLGYPSVCYAVLDDVSRCGEDFSTTMGGIQERGKPDSFWGFTDVVGVWWPGSMSRQAVNGADDVICRCCYH